MPLLAIFGCSKRCASEATLESGFPAAAMVGRVVFAPAAVAVLVGCLMEPTVGAATAAFL